MKLFAESAQQQELLSLPLVEDNKIVFSGFPYVNRQIMLSKLESFSEQEYIIIFMYV